MAKIIYALSGQGRGHTSRVIAVSDALRENGHEITFCCGGTAREILESRGEDIIPVPPLRQVLEGNEVRHLKTIRCNWKEIRNLSGTVSQLADIFSDQRADLLITDFEAFSPRAAEQINLPVLSFNHQQVVTETQYRLPVRYWLEAALTGLAIRVIAPRRPEHVLVTSFFYPPVRHPDRTTLVPPIIRPVVENLSPTRGDHVLVYYNHGDGADHALNALRKVNAPFIVYNLERPERTADYPNIVFKKPSLEGFLEDLATSRAVLCTAGFTLTSEALYLGKPLLVVPNRGVFEQTLNAIFLQREALGSAVIDRPLTSNDVSSFLADGDIYRERLRQWDVRGNQQAVEVIERLLRELEPRYFPRTALPRHPVSGAVRSTPVGNAD